MSAEHETEPTRHQQLIEQLIELQREYAFEHKGKESERRRKLRDLIEAATATKGG